MDHTESTTQRHPDVIEAAVLKVLLDNPDFIIDALAEHIANGQSLLTQRLRQLARLEQRDR